MIHRLAISGNTPIVKSRFHRSYIFFETMVFPNKYRVPLDYFNSTNGSAATPIFRYHMTHIRDLNALFRTWYVSTWYARNYYLTNVPFNFSFLNMHDKTLEFLIRIRWLINMPFLLKIGSVYLIECKND